MKLQNPSSFSPLLTQTIESIWPLDSREWPHWPFSPLPSRATVSYMSTCNISLLMSGVLWLTSLPRRSSLRLRGLSLLLPRLIWLELISLLDPIMPEPRREEKEEGFCNFIHRPLPPDWNVIRLESNAARGGSSNTPNYFFGNGSLVILLCFSQKPLIFVSLKHNC